MNDTPAGPVGIVCSEKFKEHRTGEGHPESPSRMEAVARALARPSLEGAVTRIEPRPAQREEILLVHTLRLYEEILATREQEMTVLDADTIASRSSAEVAHLAAGAVLSAVDAVVARKVSSAFAFVRPPGHHAKPDKAMGFCFFNNVAIAAQYAIRSHGMRRILIVDFDLHHGNGTQKVFYTSPQVLYVSTHQWPHYPGTGSLEELGKDSGEGFTVNIPMSAGMGDAEYLHVFREIVAPLSIEFSPELVLVSAGFDAHQRDPLGSMALTHEGFAALAGEILAISRATCEGRAVFALEGGYHPEGLELSIASVLEVMAGITALPDAPPGGSTAGELVASVRRELRKYWKSIG